MLTKVTITGADDSVHPIELIKLSHEFPFVEWGLLVSKKALAKGKTPRFPSHSWLKELSDRKQRYGDEMMLSCHLCGTYLRELCRFGSGEFLTELQRSISISHFRRVQLNFHGEPHSPSFNFIDTLKDFLEGQEIIVQYDNVNMDILTALISNRIECSALFDLSHGGGILPSQWPEVLTNVPCGYAGGLSPDNLEEQIKLIEQKAGQRPIWIDMETHVRSNMDYQFDLGKVRKCLEIASKFVTV